MRRLLFLLSLIAALTGTPLRQAEAAHDFVCSLAELDGGDIIEEIDGGVGDDSGATIQRVVAHTQMILSVTEALPTLIGSGPVPRRPFPAGRSNTTFPSRLPPSNRLALLQCFLF